MACSKQPLSTGGLLLGLNISVGEHVRFRMEGTALSCCQNRMHASFHPDWAHPAPAPNTLLRSPGPRSCPLCPSPAGPKEKLDSTAVSQPAIYVASLAALEKLKAEQGEEAASAADVTCGLSLGEYTALTYAGGWWEGGRMGVGRGISSGKVTVAAAVLRFAPAWYDAEQPAPCWPRCRPPQAPSALRTACAW